MSNRYKPNYNRSTNYKIAGAKANKNRTGSQAEFRGNATTPIKKGANEGNVLNHLGAHAGKNTQLGQQSKDLLNHLGNVKGGWKVTAGVHQGGLGGAQGGADAKNHITLSTGHHLRFNNKDQLQEITGPSVRQSKGRQGGKQPSDTENRMSGLQTKHGLSPQEAGKVLQYTKGKGGMGENEAVNKVKSNRRK
jgi:hypothetical protein